MDKTYDQTRVEEKWYKFWEENNLFAPEINPDGNPYTIILPPPNANADLHLGHAMMSVEDILIRYRRMKGDAALWLPGSDHAGFETQVVFERNLPNEERYKEYIGKEIDIETVLGPAKIKVISDEAVDKDFGTGVVKVTPAHSATDFEIGQRHNLEVKQVINFDGKLNEKAGKFAGMKVKEARAAITFIPANLPAFSF